MQWLISVPTCGLVGSEYTNKEQDTVSYFHNKMGATMMDAPDHNKAMDDAIGEFLIKTKLKFIPGLGHVLTKNLCLMRSRNGWGLYAYQEFGRDEPIEPFCVAAILSTGHIVDLCSFLHVQLTE